MPCNQQCNNRIWDICKIIVNWPELYKVDAFFTWLWTIGSWTPFSHGSRGKERERSLPLLYSPLSTRYFQRLWNIETLLIPLAWILTAPVWLVPFRPGLIIVTMDQMNFWSCFPTFCRRISRSLPWIIHLNERKLSAGFVRNLATSQACAGTRNGSSGITFNGNQWNRSHMFWMIKMDYCILPEIEMSHVRLLLCQRNKPPVWSPICQSHSNWEKMNSME